MFSLGLKVIGTPPAITRTLRQTLRLSPTSSAP